MVVLGIYEWYRGEIGDIREFRWVSWVLVVFEWVLVAVCAVFGWC